jgi:hypothetical protein
MRSSLLVGIVIAALGLAVLFTGAGFTTRHDVVQVGGLTVTAENSHTNPKWVGGAIVLAGLVLVGAGTMKRS